MPFLFAQIGLAVTAIIFGYVIFGLPVMAVIASIAAILGGGSGRKNSRIGLGWSRGVFIKTFVVQAISIAALALAACIRAMWTIPG